jgi:uncharacterized membrane-anchored protein YhcB (DUF1043 family)
MTRACYVSLALVILVISGLVVFRITSSAEHKLRAIQRGMTIEQVQGIMDGYSCDVYEGSDDHRYETWMVGDVH